MYIFNHNKATQAFPTLRRAHRAHRHRLHLLSLTRPCVFAGGRRRTSAHGRASAKTPSPSTCTCSEETTPSAKSTRSKSTSQVRSETEPQRQEVAPLGLVAYLEGPTADPMPTLQISTSGWWPLGSTCTTPSRGSPSPSSTWRSRRWKWRRASCGTTCRCVPSWTLSLREIAPQKRE